MASVVPPSNSSSPLMIGSSLAAALVVPGPTGWSPSPPGSVQPQLGSSSVATLACRRDGGFEVVAPVVSKLRLARLPLMAGGGCAGAPLLWCWCLKEAFVQAIGAGFGFGLHRLEFHHVHWTNICIYIDGVESRNWRFWLFKLDEVHLASIANGHPEDAVNSYKRTLPNVVVEEDELYAALEIPEEAFTLQTVEQLTQLQD